MECPDGVYAAHWTCLSLRLTVSPMCALFVRVCGCARWCMRAYDCRIDSIQNHTTKPPMRWGIFPRNSQIRLCAMNMWSYTHTRMLWQTNFAFNGKLADVHLIHRNVSISMFSRPPRSVSFSNSFVIIFCSSSSSHAETNMHQNVMACKSSHKLIYICINKWNLSEICI